MQHLSRTEGAKIKQTSRHLRVLQAEVQSFYADGAIALHTRSLKYGKVSSLMLAVPIVIMLIAFVTCLSAVVVRFAIF